MPGQFVEQSLSPFLQMQCPAGAPWRNYGNFRSKTWKQDPGTEPTRDSWSQGKVMGRDIP